MPLPAPTDAPVFRETLSWRLPAAPADMRLTLQLLARRGPQLEDVVAEVCAWPSGVLVLTQTKGARVRSLGRSGRAAASAGPARRARVVHGGGGRPASVSPAAHRFVCCRRPSRAPSRHVPTPVSVRPSVCMWMVGLYSINVAEHRGVTGGAVAHAV
jgi:hypothetical protein